MAIIAFFLNSQVKNFNFFFDQLLIFFDSLRYISIEENFQLAD